MEPHGLPLVGTCSPREESDRRGVEATSRLTGCAPQRASFPWGCWPRGAVRHGATCGKSLLSEGASYSSIFYWIVCLQFSSVAQSCLTLCDPMDCSTPGFPVHQQLPELAQTHSIESVMPSSHLVLSSPAPPAFNLSQHQGLFQYVSSSHQVAKVLELWCKSFK